MAHSSKSPFLFTYHYYIINYFLCNFFSQNIFKVFQNLVHDKRTASWLPSCHHLLTKQYSEMNADLFNALVKFLLKYLLPRLLYITSLVLSSSFVPIFLYQRTSTMLISQWKSKWSHKPSSTPPLRSAPVGAKQSSPPQTLNALSWVLSLKSTLT